MTKGQRALARIGKPAARPTKRSKAAYFAKGRLKAGVMNKTEARYAEVLKARCIAGEIQWWKFEGMTFKLGDDMRYTPDFAVMLADDTMEFHECKGGYVMDDSVVKWKTAGEMFPFRFIMVFSLPMREGGGWKRKVYGERDAA